MLETEQFWCPLGSDKLMSDTWSDYSQSDYSSDLLTLSSVFLAQVSHAQNLSVLFFNMFLSSEETMLYSEFFKSFSMETLFKKEKLTSKWQLSWHFLWHAYCKDVIYSLSESVQAAITEYHRLGGF